MDMYVYVYIRAQLKPSCALRPLSLLTCKTHAWEPPVYEKCFRENDSTSGHYNAD